MLLMFLLVLFDFVVVALAHSSPHIVLIVADDLGWNDVGFHGSNQIPTPNIDALAYNGVQLHRLYSQSTCSPSRAALLTGRYPLRFGYQGMPLAAGERRQLPAYDDTLPKSLQRLGYVTRLIGKWHLGAARRNDTALGHGFDSHWGYWHGYIDYFTHTIQQHSPHSGLDLHDNFTPVYIDGYATDLFTAKAVEYLDQHKNKSQPLFLQINHLAPHTGKELPNRDTIVQVPDQARTDVEFGYIRDAERRLFAGALASLDDSIGTIITVLQRNKMLKNTIIIFTSDNGGSTFGLHANRASNYPLRGKKSTLFEGGIRVPGIIYYAKFRQLGRIYDKLMHFTDWYPTLIKAAGGNPNLLQDIDGIDHWTNIASNADETIRRELLVDVDDTFNTEAYILAGRFKYIKHGFGSTFNYSGYSGRQGSYNIDRVMKSITHSILDGNMKHYRQLRTLATLPYCRTDQIQPCYNGCLFDLQLDPCESRNIADKHPHIVAKIVNKLHAWRGKMVANHLQQPDAASDPLLCNATWFNWLDACPIKI